MNLEHLNAGMAGRNIDHYATHPKFSSPSKEYIFWHPFWGKNSIKSPLPFLTIIK